MVYSFRHFRDLLSRCNGKDGSMKSGLINSERKLAFLGKLSADRRLFVNANRKNAIVL